MPLDNKGLVIGDPVGNDRLVFDETSDIEGLMFGELSYKGFVFNCLLDIETLESVEPSNKEGPVIGELSEGDGLVFDELSWKDVS